MSELLTKAKDQRLPCIHLVDTGGGQPHCGYFGGTSEADPVHKKQQFEWKHVFTCDASLVPDGNLQGSLRVYNEYDNRSSGCRMYQNHIGLVADESTLKTMRKADQENYRLVSNDTETNGPTDIFMVELDESAFDISTFAAGAPLSTLGCDSFPAVEDLDPDITRKWTSEDEDAYIDLLSETTPLHGGCSSVLVLGGYRHTLREHTPDETAGLMLFSMIRVNDEWLEAWLKPNGEIETILQGW